MSGPIKIHYWLLPISRGNNVRLVCAELGLPFEDVQVGNPGPEWLTKYKKETMDKHVNLGTLPYITLPDGRVLGEHVAAMKYLARKHGKPELYPVDDIEKQYLVDEMFDLNQDWRVARRNAETYTDEVRHTILTTMEMRYAKDPYHGAGPYLLGKDLCVADLFTFQTLNEIPVAIRNAEEEAKFPELVKLWRAVAARPGIAALLEKQKPDLVKLQELLDTMAAAAAAAKK